MHETQLRALNPRKTASLEAIPASVLAEAQTVVARWQVACQGDRELHVKVRTEKVKRNAVDKYFQAVKRKAKGQGQEAIMFYDDGSFESSGAGAAGGVQRGRKKGEGRGQSLKGWASGAIARRRR